MKKGYFFILIATIAFSSMEVVLKLIAGEVNPVQLTLARFSIGFVFLAPVAVYTLKKRSKRLDRKSVAYFALLGLIGIAICMPIYQMSINFTESSVVAVLFSCNPVFVTFFAFMILKEPIKRRHLAALSLEILGTLAIINPLHIKLNMVGVGLALCSTVLFSIYGVMGKRKCAEYGGLLGDYLYHGPRNPLPSSYGPPSVVSVFADFDTPIVAVRGNCDAEVDLMLLPFAVEDSAVIAADGLRIVAQHGHHLPSCPPIPGVRPGDVVLSGHTHIPRGETVDGVHFWNPGSTTLPKGGFPASYGVFEAGAFRVFGLDGRLLLEHRPSAA